MRTDRVLTDDAVTQETWIGVPSAALILVNANLGSHFRVVLDQNSTLGVVNGTSGRVILIRVEQDATGGRTLSPDGSVTGTTNFSLTTTASAVSFVLLAYDEFAQVWNYISIGGTAGANTALSNLAAVAINASLLPGADNTIDLGSVAFSWRTLYAETSVLTPVVNGGSTMTVYGASSTAALYIDANGIGLYISGKPVSAWTGSLLSIDAAVGVGNVGTSGFSKSASGASGNFDCVYNGTTIWRIPDTSTFHLVDVNAKLGVTTGTKWGTTTSQKQGWWNATPVAQDTGWVDTTNHTDKKTLDESTGTLADALNMLGTIQRILKTYGLLGG